MKKLSIIIVTYNSGKDIYDCLDSIYSHCDIPIEELEIIIVDNNSFETDIMFDTIQHKYDNNIVLIKNSVNGGYGQGNNVGIRKASAPIILIMNPDVRLTSGSFKSVLMQFEKDPKLSMYGMKQLLDDNRPSVNSFNCNSMVNGYLATILTGFCNRRDIYIPRYMYFSGSCFYIRKSMFESVGLFDESIFMYGEENDIFHRMKSKHGVHFIYNKDITYKHLTLDRMPDEKTEDKMLFSNIRVNEKFGYPKHKTIRNKIQNVNLLLLRERVKKALSMHYDANKISMLTKYKMHLNNLKQK